MTLRRVTPELVQITNRLFIDWSATYCVRHKMRDDLGRLAPAIRFDDRIDAHLNTFAREWEGSIRGAYRVGVKPTEVVEQVRTLLKMLYVVGAVEASRHCLWLSDLGTIHTNTVKEKLHLYPPLFERVLVTPAGNWIAPSLDEYMT